MRKSVLISFFQSANLGDIILSNKLYEKINDKREVVKVDFVTGDNVKEVKSLMESSYHIKSNNPIKERLKNFKVIREIIDIKNTYKCLKRVDWQSVGRRIEECDDVIIGGGNMIMGLSYDFIFLFYKYLSVAKKYNKSINVVCVGVGPFKNSIQKLIIKKALKGINNISTRDILSKRILEEITGDSEIKVSGDPALLCERFDNKDQKEYISISVYPHGKEKNNELYSKYMSELSDLIIRVYDEFNKDIVLFSTEANDYEAVYDLYSNIDNNIKKYVKVVKVESFDDLISLYNKTQILIGTRLHSIIIAYSQLIPVIGLSWQSKVKGFFNYIGKDNNVFDINNISESSDTILSVCRKTFLNYEEECRSIEINKKRLRTKFDNSLMCLDGE